MNKLDWQKENFYFYLAFIRQKVWSLIKYFFIIILRKKKLTIKMSLLIIMILILIFSQNKSNILYL